MGNNSCAVPKRREYKIFTVLKGDGEIKSMKIREMANA